MYGLRGLGAFDPPARPAFIDPGYPPDPGIVALNTANNNAYQRAMELAQASNNYDQCEANAQNATSQAQYDQVMAMCRGQAAQQTGPEAGDLPVTYFTPGQPLSYTPGGPGITPPSYTVPAFAQNPPAFVSPTPTVATPGATRGGTLSFTSSSGSTSLRVGDTWTVKITGASPNAAVAVSGSMPGSTFEFTRMGVTDGNGNFTKSGTVGIGDVGAWQESWYVNAGGRAGNALAGSVSFTVSPVLAANGGAGAGSGSGSGAGSGSGSGSGDGSGSSFVAPFGAGFSLASVPWWGWAAAAGVGFLALGGKGGR